MKKLALFLCALLAFSALTFAQTLYLNENFDYGASPNADLTTASANWARHSGAQGPQYIVTSLSYAGYPSSNVGGACSFQNGSSGTNDGDVNRTFTDISATSTIYVSFLVSLASAKNTSDYFFHLGLNPISTSVYRGKVFAVASSTPNKWNIGVSKMATSTPTMSVLDLDFNKTYLVVLKYEFNTTANNDDQVTLFLYDSSVPVSESATNLTTIGPVNDGASDPSDIGSVIIRQGTNSPTGTIDGIRVATTWTALLPQAGLTAPVATAATNVTANSFTANWGSVSTATNYILDVSTVADFSTFVTGFNMKDVGNVTTFDVTGLDPNTTYYYRVHSWDGTNASANSNTITVVTVVAAPVATEATNVITTGFTANWNSSAGATNYWLDVSSAYDFSALVTGFDNKDVGNVTTFDVSSLSTGFTYYYRVRASNTHGTSTNSNIITVGTGVLAAPLALSATNITTTSFTARWNSSATATTYLLDVSTASDFSTFITDYNGKDVGNVTSCNVTSLSGSTIYYYRLRASNSGGTSAYSNTITVTTLLAAPVATAATNISATGFTANWNSSAGATNYWVDVSTTDDFSNVLASYNNKSVGNVTTHIIISLTPNTTYYFRVCASNSSGTSPYSNTITVTTNVTGVDDLLNLPTRFDLSQNYPNPFNPTTTIQYQIPKETFVSIKVYNVIGSEISTLVNSMKSPGTYEVKFDAGQLTSGIYIYKIQAGDFLQTKKMILMK